jgi:arginine exporter protein ArgO
MGFYLGTSFASISMFPLGARGGAVVEALRTNQKVVGSIPNGVIGILH